MDSGDVESSGAVDYNPDADTSVNSGGPVENEKSVDKIAAEDVHFHASDISRPDNNEFFNNPKEQKRREKEEQKRIKLEAKRMLKESKAKNKAGGASASVAESEKQLKKEQSRIEGEHRQAKFGAFLNRIAKRWYIIVAAIAVIALTVCGIIFVPKIIEGMAKAADDDYVEKNMTPMLRIFKEVAANTTLKKEEIEKIVAKYSGDGISVDYDKFGGTIHRNDDFWMETVKMSVNAYDSSVYYGFTYTNRSLAKNVLIIKNDDKYTYLKGGFDVGAYGSTEEVIRAFILDNKEEKNE